MSDKFRVQLIHNGESIPAPSAGVRQVSPRVSLELIPAGPAPFEEFAVQVPYVSVMVAFGEHSSWEAIGAKPLVKRHFRNRFHFLPAGTELNVRIDAPMPEFMLMYVEASFAASITSQLFDHKDIGMPAMGNAEAKLLALGKTIRCQMLGQKTLKALQLESIATLCLAEWWAHETDEASSAPSPRTFDKVKDYMQAHLDCDLTLADLAAIAELSPSHFLRSFKETTGQTPHRYLTERRVDWARKALETTDLPLAEVAYDAGFASQSHMTDVFKTHLNISPGRYRKSMRS